MCSDSTDVRGMVPGDPVLPGQLPLRVYVDHAALDIVRGQTRRQSLELGPELAQHCRYLDIYLTYLLSTDLLARPAPVSVELDQRVRARVDEGVEVVAGELGGKQAYTPDEEWWLLQPQIERRE